jgi:hypothetical protein
MKNRVFLSGQAGHGSLGFLGSRVAGSSPWIPPELLHRRISVPVADHGGSGPHGSWVTGSTGFGFSLSRVISGSRAHRRSRRRCPLVSTAPPTGGSGSDHSSTLPISSLSQNLSALSRSHLPISLLPQSLRLSLLLSLWVWREGQQKRKKKKKEEERKKNWQGGCCETEGEKYPPLIHSHTCGYG